MAAPVLALATLVALWPTVAQPPAPDTSIRAVVAAAAAYVAEYQKPLTNVLAEETYTQQILAQVPGDTAGTRARRLRSETFFLFTAPQHGWMAIRDVIEVDGRPVSGRRRPLEVLETLPPERVAAEFKDHNSRFNIGRTYRNFNEPTLSLLVLDQLHRARFSFDRRRVERDGDEVLVTIAFREHVTPTLIRDVRRGRIFSRGEILIEAVTGRVRRTELTARIEDRIQIAHEWTGHAPTLCLSPHLGGLARPRFEEPPGHGQDHRPDEQSHQAHDSKPPVTPATISSNGRSAPKVIAAVMFAQGEKGARMALVLARRIGGDSGEEAPWAGREGTGGPHCRPARQPTAPP